MPKLRYQPAAILLMIDEEIATLNNSMLARVLQARTTTNARNHNLPIFAPGSICIEILPTETMKICSHILYTKIYAEDKHIAIGPAKETENIVRMKTIAFKESESTF